jgi:hypothetical protein
VISDGRNTSQTTRQHTGYVIPEPIKVIQDLEPVPITSQHVVHLPKQEKREHTIMQPVTKSGTRPVQHTVSTPVKKIVNVPQEVTRIEYEEYPVTTYGRRPVEIKEIIHVPTEVFDTIEETHTDQEFYTYTENVPVTVTETVNVDNPTTITATHW